jgi:hypothetical protein
MLSKHTIVMSRFNDINGILIIPLLNFNSKTDVKYALNKLGEYEDMDNIEYFTKSTSRKFFK